MSSALVHRLPEEVVGANGAGDMVAGPVAALRLLILAREINGDFELRQNIALHVQSDLGRIRRGFSISEQCPQMIGSQIHFIGQRKFGRRNSELVGLGRFLEDFVAARIFHFKGQFATGGCLMIGAIERQRPHVDGLAGLIDGFFGGEQNRDFVFQAHLLREFRRADRRVDDVAQRITARQAGGKAELRFRGPSAIQRPREQNSGFLPREPAIQSARNRRRQSSRSSNR